ncbi:MAG TPA: TadE/TadG family type IV pilus assembly protein [Stellaceae bacterium]|nr:TadE/TadG family type IV pilus assembly protein [Stellaceae bacterium]
MRTGSLLACLRRVLRNRRGTAALEFGLLVPVLSTMVVGITDLSLGFAHKMAVQDAAEAGAQYAVLHGWSSSAVSSAITSATRLSGITASPAPSESCGCPSGTTITAATCGSTCASGRTASTYVTANAQYSYRMILSYPGLSNPVTLSASATVRIQ